MKILVLDLETTAIKHWQGAIVEIGAVILDLKTKTVEKAFDYLIKEKGKDVDDGAWIFINSDLTLAELEKNGRDLEDVRDELQILLDKYPCVAYNQQFDFGWLRSRRFTIPRVCSDPMYILTDILQIPGNYGKYKWPSVQESMKYFNMEGMEPHRAFQDAEIEAQIIVKMIENDNYELDMAKLSATTNELKKVRYLTKIDAYHVLIKKLRQYMTWTEIELEKVVDTNVDSQMPFLARIETYKHSITHFQEKIGFCEKYLNKIPLEQKVV